MPDHPVYSVVVAVFNSEGSIRELVDRTLRVFSGLSVPVEIILVNDGSVDGSWEVLLSLATEHSNVRAIDLLKNYGQHSAILCGLRHTSGEYVILLDDDLQNPPEEIPKLMRKASEGYDLVYGQFQKKRHALYRRWGSFIIGLINRHIFRQPRDLVVTNFPILHRSVVDRVCSYRSIQPYIPGLSLMYATNPGNVLVEHQERTIGSSNYNFVRITRLVMRILFAYSAFPLRMVAVLGLLVSALSFILGTYYLIQPFLREVPVPGWTTLVVLLAFFNGITLLMLGMLGEYLVRILNQTSGSTQYEVRRESK